MDGEKEKLSCPWVWAIALFFGTVMLTCAFARFESFHNQTFDLAFYGRMAWGIPRGSFWDPIVNAHIFGLHISPVLVPLGLLGMVFGTVPVLLLSQVLAVVGAAFPLARVGRRRLGKWGGVFAALLWFFFPNLGHVVTYEFHPGTLAVLPLAFLLDALDRGDKKALLGWTALVLLCREDLGLVTAMVGLAALRVPALRKAGAVGFSVSILWVAVFLFLVHPAYGPETGSLQLHFGQWGQTTTEVLGWVLTHPIEVLRHFATEERLLYLPLLLIPLAGLPLLSPRALLIMSPMIAINLLSSWPTAVELDSHYQTILLPALVLGAIDGAGRVRSWLDTPVLAGCLMAASAMLLFGGYPWSLDFDDDMFRDDQASASARAILASVPEGASLQAPYPLMPHAVERLRLGPEPPPNKETEFVVLDISHRTEHMGSGDLLRTKEEPNIRQWLSRDNFGLIQAEFPYLLFQADADPTVSLDPYRSAESPTGYQPLTGCLAVAQATIQNRELTLHLRASDSCPGDLALRLGTAHRPRRVDLLFDGLASPAHLRSGDTVSSMHPLSELEAMEIGMYGLRIGAVRASGARPSPNDPVTVSVPLR